ncbi:MAG: hypothetical protein IKH99_01095 [Prevotella sp.]|nr:hypothetical protein [Prevotella sp.]
MNTRIYYHKDETETRFVFFIRWIRVIRVRFLLYELDKFDEFFVACGENQRTLPTGKSKSNKI